MNKNWKYLKLEDDSSEKFILKTIIGKGIALSLGKNGAKVYITGLHNNYI
jgi:hypothetical protein